MALHWLRDVGRLPTRAPRRACRPFAERYAKDQAAFFEDYAAAHLQRSELGAEWDVEPFTLDD